MTGQGTHRNQHWNGVTLHEYIRSLVDQGKTGEHEDFKILYTAFGEERIRKIAREYWLARKADKS